MSEFKFECPHCGQHLACDTQFSGRQIQCPSCHHLIHIPPAPGQTNQYQPESGMTWATFAPPAAPKPPPKPGK
jgi:DNA-directed RNA polymerase subunit RPC12/RpoP